MSLVDYFVIGVIALIIGGAVIYVVREKKRGRACIGCPYCSSCAQKGGNCTEKSEENQGESGVLSAHSDSE